MSSTELATYDVNGYLRVLLDDLPKTKHLRFIPYYMDELGYYRAFDSAAVEKLVADEKRALLEGLKKQAYFTYATVSTNYGEEPIKAVPTSVIQAELEKLK